MFAVQFGQTKKRKNSTQKVTVGDTYNCLLLDNTSIVTPILKIRFENPSTIFQYNYCYIPAFNRYYFITNIVSESSTVFMIYCECDVLATFRDDILATKAFVQYVENGGNPAIPDSRLPKAVTSTIKLTSQSIPGFTPEGSFALTLASDSDGKTGCSKTVLVDAGNMASISKRLFDPSFLETIKDYFNNPMDAVISCTWTPYDGGGGGSAITIAGENVGSGKPAIKTVHGIVTVPVDLKYSPMDYDEELERYADYRNCEPFAEHAIFLPGAGLSSLPALAFIGSGTSNQFQLTINYDFSPCTGDITYRIAGPENTGAQMMMVCGNLGVQVPIAQKTSGFMRAATNLAQTIGAAAVLAETGGLSAMAGLEAGITGGGIGFGINAQVNTISVSGSLGGWANADSMYKQISVISRYYDISDNPAAIGSTIGRPLFKVKTLGSLKGYVNCRGAHVATWATKEENDMISSYLNNYGSQPYGGVIIE